MRNGEEEPEMFGTLVVSSMYPTIKELWMPALD